MDGTWIGVASPNLPLGRDSSLNTINADEARVWWWRAGGHVWQNHGGSETDRRERRRASNFRRGQEIRMILDCEAETLQFFASPTSEEPVATLVGVTGPVRGRAVHVERAHVVGRLGYLDTRTTLPP